MLCRNKIGCTFVAALVLLCLRPEVQAETISIAASDNAVVKKDVADTDQSEAQTLGVKHSGGKAQSRFTYLRFDLSPLSAAATINSASLDLYWLSAAGYSAVSVCALKDLAIGGGGISETSWSGNLTYNTRPDGTGGLPNPNTSDSLASLDFVPGAPAKLASLDLTSALPGLLASDTNSQLTLILYGWGGDDLWFASLANTAGNPVPTLNVDWNPIPEPGTLALLGMALLGLGWYGWRRRVPKIAVAAIVAFGLATAVQAETISIMASDNAWVQKNEGGADKTEAETLLVNSNGTNQYTRLAYLRFDLGPLANATDITSASLDLYWLTGGANNTVYVCALNDLANGALGTTETSWSGNLTWNTRPEGTSSLPPWKTSDVLASLPKTGNAGKVARFDLTSALPGLLESDTNSQLTLILYGENANDCTFASLANTKSQPVPTLTVDYTNPIPEPGTLALLGMALLGLGWYVWRKGRVRG